MTGYTFTSRIKKWTSDTEKKLDAAVLTMATDIHREAVLMAPRDESALVNSGRIERVKAGFYKIIFGGGRVPYAKRRHYENKKNPHTLRYLEKPGDRISRNIRKYLRGI